MQWYDTYYAQKLQEDIVKTKIDIIKYNYSMDKEVQNSECFQSLIEIPSNAEDINIYNKSLANNEFVVVAHGQEHI